MQVCGDESRIVKLHYEWTISSLIFDNLLALQVWSRHAKLESLEDLRTQEQEYELSDMISDCSVRALHP